MMLSSPEIEVLEDGSEIVKVYNEDGYATTLTAVPMEPQGVRSMILPDGKNRLVAARSKNGRLRAWIEPV